MKLSPYHKIFYNSWVLSPGVSNYNVVFDQVLSHTLDISRLRSALYRLISDYIILNSHIEEINNELYWTVNREIRLLECFEYGEDYAQILKDFILQPFDLEGEPLYRFGVFCNADRIYRFIMVLHHILIDGSSFNSLIAQISKE